MEEKAQNNVLDNINAAIYNKKRLIQESHSYDHVPTLKEFIENNGQDIRLIYKGNKCWSSLKREAGLCTYTDDANTKRFQNYLSNLTHVNTASYLHFILKVMDHLTPSSLPTNVKMRMALCSTTLCLEKKQQGRCA